MPEDADSVSRLNTSVGAGWMLRTAVLLLQIIQSITGPWTWRNLLGWATTIMAILFVKGCLIDQYVIPSGSMEPTLRGDPRYFYGDRILVNKWRFGPRIPFTTRRLWQWDAPDRWDIVVFRSIDPDAAHPILVKRVVGLPGEKVHIQEGKVWINGEQAVPPEPLENVLHYTDKLTLPEVERMRCLLRFAQENEPIPRLNPYYETSQMLYQEMERLHAIVLPLDVEALSDEEVKALCRDVPPRVLNLINNFYDFSQPEMKYGIHEDPQYSVVPEGHYLLLGDNSNASFDGRMYGWVPSNHLYGSAFAVWWPWNRHKDLSGFSHTWWGKSLLYGIPALLILAETGWVWQSRRRRKKNQNSRGADPS